MTPEDAFKPRDAIHTLNHALRYLRAQQSTHIPESRLKDNFDVRFIIASSVFDLRREYWRKVHQELIASISPAEHARYLSAFRAKYSHRFLNLG